MRRSSCRGIAGSKKKDCSTSSSSSQLQNVKTSFKTPTSVSIFFLSLHQIHPSIFRLFLFFLSVFFSFLSLSSLIHHSIFNFQHDSVDCWPFLNFLTFSSSYLYIILSDSFQFTIYISLHNNIIKMMHRHLFFTSNYILCCHSAAPAGPSRGEFLHPIRQDILRHMERVSSEIFAAKTDATKRAQAAIEGRNWLDLDYPRIKKVIENPDFRCWDKCHLQYGAPARWGENDEFFGVEKVKSRPEAPIRGIPMEQFVAVLGDLDNINSEYGENARAEATQVLSKVNEQQEWGKHPSVVVRIRDFFGGGERLKLEVRRFDVDAEGFRLERGPWDHFWDCENFEMWKEIQMHMQQHGRATVKNCENVPFVRFRVKESSCDGSGDDDESVRYYRKSLLGCLEFLMKEKYGHRTETAFQAFLDRCNDGKEVEPKNWAWKQEQGQLEEKDKELERKFEDWKAEEPDVRANVSISVQPWCFTILNLSDKFLYVFFAQKTPLRIDEVPIRFLQNFSQIIQCASGLMDRATYQSLANLVVRDRIGQI